MCVMEVREAAQLARRLMGEHGVADWSFGFDRAKVRAGACHHSDRRITLSRAITGLHDEAQVRETLLHEIAHALVGPQHGHDRVWRAQARAIGSTGERCYSAEEATVPGRWEGRCAAGHVVQRHRRPTRVLVCTRCRGMPTVERVIAWTHDGRVVDHSELGPVVRETMSRLNRLTSR